MITSTTLTAEQINYLRERTEHMRSKESPVQIHISVWRDQIVLIKHTGENSYSVRWNGFEFTVRVLDDNTLQLLSP